MSRSCASAAMVVGADHRLPEDPCEYNPEASLGPGCNQLRCNNCGEHVRNACGLRVKDSPGREELPALYEADDWSRSPLVEPAHKSWRLYACRCAYWQEADTHYLVNDGDSPGDTHMNWVCGGHPAPVLPVTLGEITISAATEWRALVQRILDGTCPRKLDRKDEGPWLWLSWLYAYLKGLPVAAELSRTIGSRIADRDERVVGAVLIFFRRFPSAEGIDQVLAHAMADPSSVATLHAVPEDDYEPSLWDVLIGILQKRTVENPAREAVDVIRKVMLSPVGGRDPLKETLQTSWEADAFRLEDAAWFAENIVALEAAGPGRWKLLMNRVVAFARNDAELESMILIGGVALIQSRRVPDAEVRAWIKQRAYPSDAWALVLESTLDKAT